MGAGLENIDDLEKLFTNLTSRPLEASYAGLDFETVQVGPGNVFTTLLLGLPYALHERMVGRYRGIYLRVFFKGSLGIDLRLESKLKPQPGDDRLAAAYTWTTTDESKLRQVLSGEALERFLSLAKHYRVSMSDEWAQLGPIRGQPKETAEAFDQFVRTLNGFEDHLAASHIGVSTLGDDSAIVATTLDKQHAEVLRSVLESAEIPCILDGYEQSSPWGVGMTNPALKIRIKVKTEDLDQATQVLSEHRHPVPTAEDHIPGMPVIERSRDPFWTILLGLIAVHVTLLILSTFRSVWDPTGDQRLIDLGALVGMPRPTEWYRLITYSFLHFDWAHLLSNIEGLLVFGWASVRLFGLGQASLVYALAALISGLGSALFIEPDLVAAGASGCVFALVAFALTGLLRLSLTVTVARWRALIRVAGWALFMLPPAFFFNYAAHLGGVAIGLLLGLLLPLAPLEPVPGFRRRGRALGGISAVILILPWMWRMFIGYWD